MAARYLPLCGCFFITFNPAQYPQKSYLPQVDLSSHTTILSTTSRTVLTQTFLNPSKTDKLNEVQYVFPLYDGVSVVGFKCTVAGRVINGVVEEKQQARKDYNEALDRGETAGLLEQFSNVADCFTSRVGNIPPNERFIVQITYLGELKHDAETDGVRFTIPTVIAPRYGSASADLGGLRDHASSATDREGIRILFDIAVEDGVTIRGVQSPSHPIAMTMGRTSSMPEEAFDNQHASATLTLGSTQLDKDFIIVVTSKGHDTPRALLETHPTIPNHRALMATLAPKFSLPSIRPEIVFVADRSGSMQGKIPILVSALKIFLKSLPVGIKFNICSFGSQHKFLWPKSKTYDESSLSAALKDVESFDWNLGGTEMLRPIKDTIKNRYKDMHLEVVIVTDGEIWNQEELFLFINEATTKSVRFFSLGIGDGASSSLVEGIARAGDGFAQFVGENEKMEKKVVRMLKGALTPHIKDYTMEVKYEKADEEFEIVESVTESLKGLDTSVEKSGSTMKKNIISLFDRSATVDDSIDDNAGKYEHLPPISTPKLLQAPHKIPPLFPFNRTSVYLLMSPEACEHAPKAIIIRATSDHGPLELEVPVQDVGTGETLHQLAARKAVHELEEGRGWITEAKDKEGKLVKTKFEGRWDEMVEREGVRLSVQFQVGSKWCSFVAVETTAKKSEEGLPDYEMIENEESGEDSGKPASTRAYSHSMAQPDKPTDAWGNPIFPAVLGGGSPSVTKAKKAKKRSELCRARMGTSSPGVSAAPSAPSTRDPGATASASVSGYDPTIEDRDAASSVQFQRASLSGMAGIKAGMKSFRQSVAAPPVSPGFRKARAIEPYAGRADSRMCDAGPNQDLVDYSDEEMETDDAVNSSAGTKTSAPEIKAASLPQTVEEKMHELISLQMFDGSWQWVDRLCAVLHIQEDIVKATLVGLQETVMATLLAVAFLEGKMSDQEGVWEMVVQKAKGWLEGKIGESKYIDGLAKVKKDVLEVA